MQVAKSNPDVASWFAEKDIKLSPVQSTMAASSKSLVEREWSGIDHCCILDDDGLNTVVARCLNSSTLIAEF